MKKLLLLLLFASLYGFPALAQSVGPKSITSSQCVAIAVGPNSATVGITVSGTWTGTLQPEVSIAGQAAANTQVTPVGSTTAQSTITANGTYTVSVAGMSTFQLCGATVASGTAVVYLNVSTASASKGGAGTPGGTLVSSIAALNTAQTAPTGTVRTQCPSAINPFAWFSMADSSWMPWLGVDVTSPQQTGITDGIITHCYKEFFNDTGTTPQAGSTQDDLLEIFHQTNPAVEPGGSYGLYVRSQLATTASGTLNIRPGGEYIEEFLQGNPGGIGTGIDAGAFGIRAQVTDNRNGTACTSNNGCGPIIGLDGAVFDNLNAQGVIPNRYGVRGEVGLEPNNGSAAGAIAAGVAGVISASGATGDSSNIARTIYALAPTGVMSDFSQFSEFDNDDVSSLSGSPPTDTYAYRDAGGDIFMSGQSAATSVFWAPQINATQGPLVLNASLAILGGISTAQYTAPGSSGLAVANIGTAGSTSYSYVVVARDTAGGTVASSTLTTATGNATLDATNFNQIRINGSRFQNGAVAFFDVYRTASAGSPGSTGKIGTCNPTIGDKSNLAVSTACDFNDKGLAGDSSSVPTGNSTGGVQAYKFATLTNCASSASPAVCGSASSGSVAVAAGSNPTLVVDTTAVTANSVILLTEDESLSTKLGVTCQTAALPTSTVVTARSAATSFTFQANGTFTANPICYNYAVLN